MYTGPRHELILKSLESTVALQEPLSSTESLKAVRHSSHQNEGYSWSAHLSDTTALLPSFLFVLQ